MKETCNAYFSLIQGAEIRWSDIEQSFPVARSAMETLFKDGQLVGQATLDNDVVYWLTKKTQFSGVLPPRKYSPCPAPEWEKDYVRTEVSMLGRAVGGARWAFNHL